MSEPSLRVHTCMEDFIYAFTKAIESYAKVKQDYDDLNSVLKCLPGEPPRRQPQGHGGSTPNHRDKGRFTPGQKREQLQLMDDQSFYREYREESYSQYPDEMDMDDSILNFTLRDSNDRDVPEEGGDEPSMAESTLDEDALMVMNSNEGQHGNAPAPCFWKFKHGKCTSVGCKMDHSEAAMIKLRNIRIMALAKSPFRPKANELTTQFETYLKQNPNGRPHDNPRAHA